MPKSKHPKNLFFDVLVVGAGAAGLGVAAAFSERGMKVAVISRRGVRGEASPRAAGILDPLLEQNKNSSLIPAAMEAFRRFPNFLRELKRATGSNARYKQTGMIYLAVGPEEKKVLKKRFQWQRRWMPSIRWMEKDEVLRRYPQAHSQTLAGLYYPKVGRLHAPTFVKIFKQYLIQKKVRFFTAERVFKIFRQKQTDFFSIELDGKILKAPKMVNAAGAWASDAKLLGRSLKVQPVRGQMLIVKGKTTSPVIFHSLSGGYLVPWEKGIHLAGSTVEYAGFKDQVTAEGRKIILSSVKKVFPSITEMKETGCWAGLRPCSADHMPLLGAMPGRKDYYIATGYFRSGILLSSFLGDLLADFVLTGRPHALMNKFLPQRFLKRMGGLRKTGRGR